ncbi:Retroviral-like aspartic protease 1 [Taenia solium]|eukprot:TsM_000980600 transcript=TsM_000980600 gene=TsM_000980600
MGKRTHPAHSKVERKEEKERENPATLVAALLFLSAIKAGFTSDSDIDYCCEILSQLAIDQSERSLAREFFHRDQKDGENDEDYARSLQFLADRAFRGCPSARVTSWVAAQFCADQRSQSVGQGRDQDTSGTSPDIGVPNDPPPVSSATSSLDPLTPDPDSGKLEGYPCRFLLDSGAARSLVNPEAFPDLFRNIRARFSSIKLLSAEGRQMKAIGETSLKITIGKESYTLQFIMCPELVLDAILGVDFLRKTGAILNFAEGTFRPNSTKQ